MPKNINRLIQLSILFIFSYSIAQWSQNPSENTPVCTHAGSQRCPQTVSDLTGGAIIIWDDTRNGEYDIYGQRLNRSGYKMWEEEGLPISINSGAQQLPKAVSDGEGGAVIVWWDTRNDEGDIYAQRIDSSGTLLWGEDDLPVCTATGRQYEPEIVADSFGIYIVWEDRRWGNQDVYCQKLDLEGNIQWEYDGAVICDDEESQLRGVIEPDGSGGCYLAWIDNRNAGDDHYFEIYAQRIDNQGNIQWEENGIPVHQEGIDHAFVKICKGENNSAIFVYDVEIDRDYYGWDINAQKIDLDGDFLWGESGIIVSGQYEDQREMEILSDNAGGAYITWTDWRNISNDFLLDIYAQRISSEGYIQWIEEGIPIVNEIYNQRFPSNIQCNQGFIITWEDSRRYDWDIFTQKLYNNGESHWIINGNPVSIVTNYQFSPTLCSNMIEGAVISWYDYRNGIQDIYAQEISKNGELGVLDTFHIEFSPEELNFGETSIVDTVNKSFKISNYGLYQEDVHQFTTVDDVFEVTDSSISINPYESCNIQVYFHPEDSLEYNSQLQFTINDSLFSISLSGTGIIGEKGDVNHDDVINVLDIIRTINIILGQYDPPSFYELWAGDLNSDDGINVQDIILIVNVILNN